MFLTDVLFQPVVPCGDDPDDDMCTGIDSSVLLPPVRRGLQLVVAIFLHLGIHRILLPALLCELFPDQDGRHWLHQHRAILWLQHDHGGAGHDILRHHWIPSMFLVHSQDLQRCQGGLNIPLLHVERNE